MGTVDGRGGRRKGLLFALLGAGLLVLLVGVGEQRVGIREPHGTADSLVVDVGVESCNGHPRVEVEESATQVRVTAYVERPGILAGEDDCADAVQARLGAPLGTRVVVDGSTGERLVVSPGE